MSSLVMNYKHIVPERKQPCQHNSRNKTTGCHWSLESNVVMTVSNTSERNIPGKVSLNGVSACPEEVKSSKVQETAI